MNISNYDDIIDSRDIIERIKELEGTEDTEELGELKALKELAEVGEYVPDWSYGETLIREDYFTEYAIDLLKDCGILPDDIPWYIEIDEEKTAENIKADYTEVDFDGVTYYTR